MSELVINSPLRQHFRPSPEVPNPSCCNVEGHLCDECRSQSNGMTGRGHYVENADRDDYLPPTPALFPLTVNLYRGDYADDAADYLPLPNTMQKILAMNSADSKRRQAPVSNSVERDEDVDYLPLPRMDF